MLSGSVAALVTPFGGVNGSIDADAYAELVAWQISEGSADLIVGGVLGEGPTLSPQEKLLLIQIAVECAGKRVPVVAATGTNSTKASITLTDEAEDSGADAVLVVVPYYNRPSQEGLYRHVEAIARGGRLPLFIENAPARTATVLGVDAIGRLARAGHIAGLVDPSADPARLAMVAEVAGRHFIQLCSDDSAAAMSRLAGGHGCVSAAANIAPRLCADLQRACTACDFINAAALQRALQPLATALSSPPDPGLIKHALSHLGHEWRPEVRLPMVAASAGTTAPLDACLSTLSLRRAAPPKTDR